MDKCFIYHDIAWFCAFSCGAENVGNALVFGVLVFNLSFVVFCEYSWYFFRVLDTFYFFYTASVHDGINVVFVASCTSMRNVELRCGVCPTSEECKKAQQKYDEFLQLKKSKQAHPDKKLIFQQKNP